MGAKAAPERRQNRIVLSESDQEFLNRLRDKFDDKEAAAGIISRKRLGRLLQIHDRYLLGALYRALLPAGDDRLTEKSLLTAVSGIVLGSDARKLRFVFDLHDTDNNGRISASELDAMLKTGLRRSRLRIQPDERKRIVKLLLKKAEAARTGIDFAAFRRLLSSRPEIRRALLSTVSVWFGADQSKLVDIRHMRFTTVLRYIIVILPYYAWRVILLTAYIGANVYFFQDAFFRYRAAGATIFVQIARGGGACLNFNGMLILIPMMRTLLTWVRKTVFSAFVPVDQNIEIHKLVARVMFFFALLHSAAHIANYAGMEGGVYTNLLFTAAGVTGLATMTIFLLMWFFSLQFIRRSRFYELFSFTHVFYWLWFPAAMIHAESFIRWTIVPVAGFLIELVIRRFIKREQTLVLDASAYESGVTHLQLKRPAGFRFQAGDYLFLRLPEISRFGWHPFTISSAPEREEYIGLHIRTLGNWTRRLFRHMQGARKTERQMSALIHGPYGSPSAGIFNSKYAVLIGAGIGVTPFASILESIVARREAGIPMKLEKVYFYWLYRGQKTFDWFAELLQELEAKASSRFLNVNIHLTDARIDASSCLLKIGMDLTAAAKRRDVLTGLSSKTNFGRPYWDQIFYDISKKHELKRINVFFCGPYPLGRVIRISARKAGFHFRMENF